VVAVALKGAAEAAREVVDGEVAEAAPDKVNSTSVTRLSRKVDCDPCRIVN